jgi:RNA polymerase sigma-70 factor (ECF subfamily)
MITSLPAVVEHNNRDATVRYLVDHASRRGFAIAIDLLGDRGEAEDAVQDALVRTLAGWQQLRDPGALEGWFFRVLANGCIGTLRRRRVASAFAKLVGRGEAQAPPSDNNDHAKLLRELDKLPAMQKAALVLRYGHDLPVEEIAAILDVGAETVKTHLRRGRSRLRDRLGVKR